MRRRALLTTIGGTMGVLAGCQGLREEGYIVPDRGCSGPLLNETNIPPDRRTIRTRTNSSDAGIPARFPSASDPPTVTFDSGQRQVIVRTVTNGDNDDEPAHRQDYARVKRLHYDDETDTLSVVFFSKSCATSGNPVSTDTALEVDVSFPESLPERVRATEYPRENRIAPMVTTVTRNGNFPVTPSSALIAESSQPDDRFGTSLALSGQTALVGVHDADGQTDEESGSAYDLVDGGTGLAYVFTYQDSQWTQQATFLPDYPYSRDGAHATVALDGNRALVFATPEQTDTPGTGYVFERSDDEWSEQTTLTRAGGPTRERLRGPVALYGDTALILGYGDRGGWAGYIFTRSGGEWHQQDRFAPSDDQPEGSKSTAVAFDRETAVVGASRDATTDGGDAGAAYVFTRSGDTWSQQAHLRPEDGSPTDRLGSSVALAGKRALIGATGGRYNGTHSGAAYIYERSGQEWTRTATLGLPEVTEPGHQFGAAVALAGQTAVVGTPRHPKGDACRRGADVAGAAHVFERRNEVWTRTATLAPSDRAGLNAFGSRIALAGDTVLIDTATTCSDREGDAVYVFSLEK
jgi:hypothetical protein